MLILVFKRPIHHRHPQERGGNIRHVPYFSVQLPYWAMHPNHIPRGKFEALTPVSSMAEDSRLLVCDNDVEWVLLNLSQSSILPLSSGSSSPSRGTSHADLGTLDNEDNFTTLVTICHLKWYNNQENLNFQLTVCHSLFCKTSALKWST